MGYRGRRRTYSRNSHSAQKDRDSDKFNSLLPLTEKQIQAKIDKEDVLIRQLGLEQSKLSDFDRRVQIIRNAIYELSKRRDNIESTIRQNKYEINKFINYHEANFIKKAFLSHPGFEPSVRKMVEELPQFRSQLLAIKEELAKSQDNLQSLRLSIGDEILDASNYEKPLRSFIKRISNAESRLDILRRARDVARKKEGDIAQREQSAADEVNKYKAYAAAYFDESRKLAVSVRKELHDQEKKLKGCPYCGESLDEIPHADHIWPLAKGGLSKKRNMVFVCSKCNLKKSDLTLREFCVRFGMNRDLIEHNLVLLDKDF